MTSTYVVGDVHGLPGKLIPLLADAGLVDPGGMWGSGPLWRGGRAALWFLGDLCDRGPSGIAVIMLVRRLQREAAAVGGQVEALLGNHDVLLVAAAAFGAESPDGRESFRAAWRRNGGVDSDLAGLTPHLAAWLATRPAMSHAGDALLVHADALFYEEYGDSVPAVNAGIRAVLAGRDPAAWDRLLDRFSQRRAFDSSREGGTERATAFLARYGGRRIVHGHTPIATVTGQSPATVHAPLVYADGLCANCDGGMYRGGPGFVYRLPDSAPGG